jgi:uncharacterized cupin superfamily protein
VSVNIDLPAWDQELDREPYRWRRAYIGRQAGCEQLGASLYEVPAGASTFPLHAHLANEELLIVISGRPTLRTLEGERELVPGDVVAFPAGKAGAHNFENRTDEPVRAIVVSTMRKPEINWFPDSDILWGRSIAPGENPDTETIVVVGKLGDTLDPFSGV